MNRVYNDRDLEKILLGYPVLKARAEIEVQELDALFPRCIASYSLLPGRSSPGDSTGNLVVKREERQTTARRARAVEIACAALTEQERELVRLLYFERWNRYQIRLSLGIARSQMFSVRRSALDKLANILLG